MRGPRAKRRTVAGTPPAVAALALLALVPAIGQAAVPDLPQAIESALTDELRLLDDLLVRAAERDDPLLPEYGQANEQVDALAELGALRSGALLVATTLAKERTFWMLRDSQLVPQGETAAYLRRETSALVANATALIDEATQAVAFHAAPDRVLAGAYAMQVLAMARAYVTEYEERREAHAIETQIISPATHAIEFATLASGLADAAGRLPDDGSLDKARLLTELSVRAQAYDVPRGLDLGANVAAVLSAAEQGSAPIALGYYLQLVRVVETARYADAFAQADDPVAAANASAHETLASVTSPARLRSAGWATFLVDEPVRELEIAANGTPGVDPTSANQVKELARAIAGVLAAEEAANVLDAVPTERGSPGPLGILSIVLAALVPRRVRSLFSPRTGGLRPPDPPNTSFTSDTSGTNPPPPRSRGARATRATRAGGSEGGAPPRRRSLVPRPGPSPPLALAFALAISLGVVTFAQSGEPPLPTTLDPPQEPGRVLLIRDTGGVVHAIVQAFEPDGTRIYHGFYDTATRNVRDFSPISTTKHNLGPDAIALADGSVQVVWWESDTNGTVYDAIESTRVVTSNWRAGEAGPIEVVNGTYSDSGSTDLAEDGSGDLAIYTVGDGYPHVFTRGAAGVWTEEIGPSLREISNNRFAQSIYGLADGFAVAWVEHDTLNFRQVDRGVVQVFDDGSWGARKVLSNATAGVAIVGRGANPWVFFVSSLLDDNGRAILGGKREVYAVPLADAGRLYPLNVSRTPNDSERFEILGTLHQGRPAVAFFQGLDDRGRFFVTYGPPFGTAQPLGRWELPELSAFFIDSLASVGDELAFTAQTAELVVDIEAGESPPRSSLLWTFVPPPIVDLEDPQVRVTLPVLDGAYRSLREARGLFFDDVGIDSETVRVRLDGDDLTADTTVTLTSFSTRLPPLDEGPHTLRVDASDFAGKATTSAAAFLIDRTPPHATATPDPCVEGDRWSPEPVAVTLTGSDDASGVDLIRYSFNNITFKDYEGPVVLGQAGLQRLYFIAFDRAGNPGAVQRAQFCVDTTPPVIDMRVAPFAAGTTRLSWTVTDPESGVASVAVAGFATDELPPTGSMEVTVRPPFTSFTLRAASGAGLAAEERRDVGFDGGRPEMDVGDLPTSAGRIRIDASDALSNVTVQARVDDGSWSTIPGPPYSYDHDPIAFTPEPHTLSVRARDEAGNAAWSNQTFTGTGEPVADDKGTPFASVLATLLALLAGFAFRSRRR